ncbi:unnamed protein product [Psylliodes chrysocephalus]|uniref:Integrase core domain-containing protein n=1 Tax=Psylliodes chrysocephalus TaxID=3402493 RepID=A0A9P0GLJ4_9CUCU|nr:unnamed protein product [Psylliodes chrysocephala]
MKFNDTLQFNNLEDIVKAGFVLPISILANIRNFCFFLHRNEFFDSLALLEDDIFQPLDSDEIFMANRMIKQYSLFKTVLYSSSILPSFGCPISRILFGIDSAEKANMAKSRKKKLTAVNPGMVEKSKVEEFSSEYYKAKRFSREGKYGQIKKKKTAVNPGMVENSKVEESRDEFNEKVLIILLFIGNKFLKCSKCNILLLLLLLLLCFSVQLLRHRSEIKKCGQLHGYRWMYLKCLQKNLVVTQDIDRELLGLLDPEGVEIRKRLRRRQYHNKGPNYLWHIDSYDKLKPYGICINGCIDGFSRHIIWLRAGPTASDPKEDLNEVVMEWNVHKISKSRNSIAPTGRPAIMFDISSLYGAKNYCVEITNFSVDSLFDHCTFNEYPCDKDILFVQNFNFRKQIPTSERS